MKKKLIRVTTVPISLGGLLQGQSKFMSKYYEVIGISSGGKMLENVAKQEEIRVIAVDMTRKITPFKDLKAFWRLYHVFRKESPFIVHSHTPKAGTLSMTAAWLAGVPHRLHTIAGLPLLEATGPKRKLLNLVERITYRCATKVYPNSRGLEQIAIKNNFTRPNKLKVLGDGSSNGIDTKYFNKEKISSSTCENLKSTLGLKEEHFVFCYVGRLVKDKGIHELVKAFIKIHQENPETRLLLVGPYEKDLDPLSPEIEYHIKTMRSILEVGWKDDVRPYMAISNCFVFPSYREGFPNVVMQAGAMGLYSIATDINGCNEIVLEGQNGTLIPPKDSQALYKKMKQQILNSSTGDSSKYRQLIQARFERTFVWDQILQEYKGLEI